MITLVLKWHIFITIRSNYMIKTLFESQDQVLYSTQPTQAPFSLGQALHCKIFKTMTKTIVMDTLN